METIRLTTAGASSGSSSLSGRRSTGDEAPLFPGVFAIFGHGNVTCLGEALEAVKDRLPTWRGQNEQSMAMAAIAFAKAKRRRQIMVATSSIGPGGPEHGHRGGHRACEPAARCSCSPATRSRTACPTRCSSRWSSSATRRSTVNDAFRPVTRYWDRITHPGADPPVAPPGRGDDARSRGLRTGLPRTAAGRPGGGLRLSRPRSSSRGCIGSGGPDPIRHEVAAAATILRAAERPLLIAGGGVHYSLATEAARRVRRDATASRSSRRSPGKSSLPWDHPMFAGPIGVTGSSSANALAAEMPTSCSRWAPGCRTSRRAHGACSATRACG